MWGTMSYLPFLVMNLPAQVSFRFHCSHHFLRFRLWPTKTRTPLRYPFPTTLLSSLVIRCGRYPKKSEMKSQIELRTSSSIQPIESVERNLCGSGCLLVCNNFLIGQPKATTRPMPNQWLARVGLLPYLDSGPQHDISRPEMRRRHQQN